MTLRTKLLLLLLLSMLKTSLPHPSLSLPECVAAAVDSVAMTLCAVARDGLRMRGGWA